MNALAPLQRVRMRAVAFGDFRKSGQTLLLEWLATHKINLGRNDCVAFVSGTGTQIQFCRPPVEIANARPSGHGKESYQVWQSTRLRLDGVWHPLMLQNYAEMIGLDIQLRRFESYLSKAVAELGE